MTELEKILHNLTDVQVSALPIAVLSDIAGQLRPASGNSINTAGSNLLTLCQLLDTNTNYRAGLQNAG